MDGRHEQTSESMLKGRGQDEHQWNGCGSETGKDERKQYRKAEYAEPKETDGKPSRDGRGKA